MWYTPIAILTTLIVGLIVSYLTHPLKSNEVDPKLIIPIGDVCCCCLPKFIRKWLRCGVDYENYFEEKTTTVTLFRSNVVSPVSSISEKVDDNNNPSMQILE